jgi:hypothetical protein
VDLVPVNLVKESLNFGIREIMLGGNVKMPKSPTTVKIAATGGMLLLAFALSQCSMFSTSNVPVDCDVVKNQQQAGVADAAIATNLGTTVDKVAACRGPKAADPLVY